MKLKTDYQKQDWIKFTFLMGLMGGLLAIGIITYVDSYLIPGLNGFTNTLELTSDWLMKLAIDKADTVSNEIKNTHDENLILGLVDTGIEEVNEKANEVVIIWIAMVIGLVVPIYFMIKIVVWITNKFEKIIKFDSKKRTFYGE